MAKGPYYPKGPKKDQNPDTIENSYQWNSMWDEFYKKEGSPNIPMARKFAAKTKALGTMRELLKGKKSK